MHAQSVCKFMVKISDVNLKTYKRCIFSIHYFREHKNLVTTILNRLSTSKRPLCKGDPDELDEVGKNSM